MGSECSGMQRKLQQPGLMLPTERDSMDVMVMARAGVGLASLARGRVGGWAFKASEVGMPSNGRFYSWHSAHKVLLVVMMMMVQAEVYRRHGGTVHACGGVL